MRILSPSSARRCGLGHHCPASPQLTDRVVLGPQLKGRQAKRALMFCLAILLLFFGLKAVLVRHGEGRGAKHLHGSSTCTFTAPTLHVHCACT